MATLDELKMQSARNIGVQTDGLSVGTATNEMLARMDPRGASRRGAALARGLDNQALRYQAMEQAAMRNAAAIMPQNQRIQISNPLGAALDSQYQNDRQFLSPEAQNVIEGARARFRSEFARGMAGANKESFKTLADYNDFINGMDSVQQHGPLIEDFVRQHAKQAIGPGLAAQWEANDQNVKSFVDWYKKTDPNATDGRSDQAIGELFNSPGLRQQFMADPNAVKYEVNPGDNSIRPMALTPEQQLGIRRSQEMQQGDLQLATQQKQRQSEIQARTTEFNALPPDTQARIDKDAYILTGAMKEKPQRFTPEQIDNLEKRTGYTVIDMPGGKQEVIQRKEQGMDETTYAKSLVDAGWQIPMVAGKPITPDDKRYQNYFDEVGQDGVTAATKADRELGTVRLVPKKGVTLMEQQASPQQSLPASGQDAVRAEIQSAKARVRAAAGTTQPSQVTSEAPAQSVNIQAPIVNRALRSQVEAKFNMPGFMGLTNSPKEEANKRARIEALKDIATKAGVGFNPNAIGDVYANLNAIGITNGEVDARIEELSKNILPGIEEQIKRKIAEDIQIQNAHSASDKIAYRSSVASAEERKRAALGR